MKRTVARNPAMSKNLVELYGPTGRRPTSPVLQDLAPRTEAGRRICEAFAQDRRRVFARMDFAELELRVLALDELRKP